MEERSSLLCRIIGHKFEKIYDEKITPRNSKEIRDTLEAIRLKGSNILVERDLQLRVTLEIKEKKYVKTYCKRCGMVV